LPSDQPENVYSDQTAAFLSVFRLTLSSRYVRDLSERSYIQI